MLTRYFDDVAKAGFDDQLTAAATTVAEGGGGSPYVISVRNESGTIYRQFIPTDASAYVELCERMEELGFDDELEADEHRGRFNAIFRRRAPPPRRARRHPILRTLRRSRDA
ncbi:MAG: hypothetical protein M3O62_09395 [Pseudomonadota bacterium]|nr:hypothetical protein [Pseudomonadota bacterium]